MIDSLSIPPVIKTFPFGSRVAVWAARAVPMLLARVTEPAAALDLWASPTLQANSPVMSAVMRLICIVLATEVDSFGQFHPAGIVVSVRN
jgi:hypothetical protein